MTEVLEVIDKGRGTDEHPVPLLFVHGAWHAAWCWDEHFLDFFAARGYRAIAVSLRCHGGSPGPKSLRRTRIRDYVDDVAETIAQLSNPPVVIGHSMGGFVVQHYLRHHAAPAAILLAPLPPKGALRVTRQIALHHPKEFLQVNVRRRLVPVVATPELARELFFSADMPDADVDTYQRCLQDESYLAFLDMLAFDLVRTKQVNRVPMLVLGAELDYIVTQRQILRTAKTYGADLDVFPGMGHDMMLEPEWKSVAERMAEWLAARGL